MSTPRAHPAGATAPLSGFAAPSGRAAFAAAALGAAAILLASPAHGDGRLAARPAAAAPVAIEVKGEVEVRGSTVALGEVATIVAPSAEAHGRLAALPLGAAPEPGGTVVLERARLERWVRARAGRDAGAVAWAGPAETRVRRAARELSGEELVRFAAAALEDAAGREGARAEVHVREVPRSIAVPVGALRVTARPVAAGSLLSRHVLVSLELRVDERPVRTIGIGVEVEVRGPAYVAAGPLPPRAAATEPGAFAVEEVRWTGLAAVPVARGGLAGLRLRRRIEAGTALTRADVEPAPVVSRGSWASLQARRGLVELEARVEVLDDGRPGDLVRVQSSSSSRAFLARVTGAGTVEAQP